MPMALIAVLVVGGAMRMFLFEGGALRVEGAMSPVVPVETLGRQHVSG